MAGRRGWGEGAVYRRQRDGLWVGTVELGRDHRGRRRRQVVYGRTKREALAKLDEARLAKRHGLGPTDQRLTTGVLSDLKALAERHKDGGPALLIIGKVAALAKSDIANIASELKEAV